MSTATKCKNGVRGGGGGGGERGETAVKTLRKPLTGHCGVDIAVAAPFFD